MSLINGVDVLVGTPTSIVKLLAKEALSLRHVLKLVCTVCRAMMHSCSSFWPTGFRRCEWPLLKVSWWSQGDCLGLSLWEPQPGGRNGVWLVTSSPLPGSCLHYRASHYHHQCNRGNRQEAGQNGESICIHTCMYLSIELVYNRIHLYVLNSFLQM